MQVSALSINLNKVNSSKSKTAKLLALRGWCSCGSTADKNVMASTSCTYKQFFIEVKTENYYFEMAEAGVDEGHWRCTEFRLKVISQM